MAEGDAARQTEYHGTALAKTHETHRRDCEGGAGVRDACREQLAEGTAEDQAWVTYPDYGLTRFTVSGLQAVMVKGAACSTRGTYDLAIYVRPGKTWRKALASEVVGHVFLSTGYDDKPRPLSYPERKIRSHP